MLDRGGMALSGPVPGWTDATEVGLLDSLSADFGLDLLGGLTGLPISLLSSIN